MPANFLCFFFSTERTQNRQEFSTFAVCFLAFFPRGNGPLRVPGSSRFAAERDSCAERGAVLVQDVLLALVPRPGFRRPRPWCQGQRASSGPLHPHRHARSAHLHQPCLHLCSGHPWMKKRKKEKIWFWFTFVGLLFSHFSSWFGKCDD